LCFGLRGDLSEKRGQIAHLDRNSTNDALDNLAFLCLPHHDQYDSRTSQSKGFEIGEIKHYRNLLYTEIARLRKASTSNFAISTPNAQPLEPATSKTFFPARANEDEANNRGIYVEHDGQQYFLPAFMWSDVPITQEYPDYGANGNDALTWGYSGTGPRWTAYSILRDLYGSDVAKRYYFSFEQQVIRKLPKASNWVLGSVTIDKWLKSAPTNDQLFPKKQHG
jgi:hypothetical protein